MTGFYFYSINAYLCYMQKVITILIFVLLSGDLFSQDKEIEVPYTLADRERLVRVEVRMNSLEKRMDNIEQEVRSGNKELRNSINNLTYSIFGLIGVFIAVLVWDRRKTLYPVLQQMDTEKEKLQSEVKHRKKIDEFLKELSKKDKKVHEAMKHAGLL